MAAVRSGEGILLEDTKKETTSGSTFLSETTKRDMAAPGAPSESRKRKANVEIASHEQRIGRALRRKNRVRRIFVQTEN